MSLCSEHCHDAGTIREAIHLATKQSEVRLGQDVMRIPLECAPLPTAISIYRFEFNSYFILTLGTLSNSDVLNRGALLAEYTLK